MDPALLQYYERELQYIREMGVEYAREFPKIASRLNLDSLQIPDPYVERLLEGFAFLTARVNMRLDAEYPRFTQNLLNIVYPHYLTPVPSMAIVQMRPSANAALDGGYVLDRGSALRSMPIEGEQTACEFRTVQKLSMWPLTIDEVEYFSNIGRLDGIEFAGKEKVRAGLRLRLRNSNGEPIQNTMLDQLRLYLGGHGSQAMKIYEQLFANSVAVLLSPADEHRRPEVLPAQQVLHPVGFADDEAMLPSSARSFSGYRLLREYFAFADRFQFFDILQLGSAVERCANNALDITVLFDRFDHDLDNRITPEDFLLHCVPIINLFAKRADRIHLTSQPSYHVVVDRTRPLDFEVFDIDKVVGHGSNTDEQQTFLPFYASDTFDVSGGHHAFYTLQRERRVLSSRERRLGPRAHYVGSECYLSLVDSAEAPFARHLKQLEVHTLCTNRDLPLRLRCGHGATDFSLDVSAPVASVRCVSGPTPPKPSLGNQEGEVGWRLINHLSLNYLTLVDRDSEAGAAALRELLALYCDPQDSTHRKQIEGVRSIRSEMVTRRLPGQGPIAFARGQGIHLTVDEAAFAGSGVFLLGAVLDAFFARYVSINSFSQLTLHAMERGRVCQWPVRLGQRHSL